MANMWSNYEAKSYSFGVHLINESLTFSEVCKGRLFFGVKDIMRKFVNAVNGVILSIAALAVVTLFVALIIGFVSLGIGAGAAAISMFFGG
jgi:hypothetical protein